MYMKNIKTKSYILWLFTLITLGVTYAYTSVSSSLTYLRWAWDIGHIGYIITEIFDTNAKIKSTYLPEGMVVENASVTQTGIVKLINATGSTSEVEAPTINILTQVWNDLNTRLSTLSWDIDAIDISWKEDKIIAWTTGQYYRWDKTWQTLDKTAVWLSNIDNTTDLNKPVSMATQTALNAKQATITGWATTILTSDLSADRALVSDGSGKVWVSSVTSMELWYLSWVTSTIQTQFNTKAPLISPNFTGIPTAPTPTYGDISTKIATTAFVESRMASAEGSSTIWKYQISCAPSAWQNIPYCCRIDTQTGETKCASFSDTVWNTWNIRWGPFTAVNASSNTQPWFFVMTNWTWNGNLWGLAWANAKCLSDLQTYDWMWKTSAGTLSSENVKAFLCDPFICQSPNGGKIYTFARSNAPTMWGANMVINTSQEWPNNSLSWQQNSHFWLSAFYWSNRSYTAGDKWGVTPTYINRLDGNCEWWLNSTSLNNGLWWHSAYSDYQRFSASLPGCDTVQRLICIVN